MRSLKPALATAATVFVLAGCTALGQPATAESSSETDETSVSPAPTTSSATLAAESILAANENATTVYDDEWSIADAVDVLLNGTSATSPSDAVNSTDGIVTISAAGVYRLSGSMTGQVVVDADDRALVVLVLDGVDIANPASSAITVLRADDIVIYLAAGSQNVLSDTTSYPEGADVNAALFSEEDMTISGTGSLEVTGNGNDAITSEDDLVILSGTITATAVDDGLRGKDSLTVRGGTITVTAGGDGFKADNEEEATRGYADIKDGSITISAGSDGVDAVTDFVMTGGELTVTESNEGIEAAQLLIAGGTLDITATDDGLNASTGTGESFAADPDVYLVIAGGDTTIDATSGDGIDSNGDALISGGTVTVYGPTQARGDGALDASGTLTVTGGTVIAFDNVRTETPSEDSPQGWIFATVSGDAGDEVQITDAFGAVIAQATSKKEFSELVFSAPEIVSGEDYTVTANSGSTTVTANQGGQSGPGGSRRR